MTAKFKRSYNTLLLSSLAAALVIAFIRAYVLLAHYDSSAGYYDIGGWTTSVPGIALLVCTVALIPFIFIWKKKLESTAPVSDGVPFYFGSAVLGTSLLSYAVTVGYNAFFGGAFGLSKFFGMLAALTAIFSCIYFISGTLEKKPQAKAFTFLTVCVCAFLLCSAFALYFDFSIPMNAPAKSLCTVTTVAMMIFFLFEARLNFGIPQHSCYTVIGLIALIMSAAYSIPNLVFYAVRNETVMGTPVHDLMLLAAFLYVLAKLLIISDGIRIKRRRSLIDDLRDSESITDEEPETEIPIDDPLQTSIFDIPASEGAAPDEVTNEEATDN